jgi:hypothetical protein
MDTPLIYLTSLAAAFGILLLWKVYRIVPIRIRRASMLYARKKLFYTMIYRRRSSSDNINVLSLCNICLLVAGNITACALKISDRKELAKRCGSLFLVNLVPLMLGGQRSILTNYISHLHSSEQSLLHRWMGRVCVVQGLIHAVINAMSSVPTQIQILVGVKLSRYPSPDKTLISTVEHVLTRGAGDSIISVLPTACV